MVMSRLTYCILFIAAVCISAARLSQTTEYSVVDTHHRSDQYCLSDSTKCDPESTCFNCCSDTLTINEKTNTTSCGTGQCLKDGIPCVTEEGFLCHKCCNKAFDDNGKTCGGKCTTSGTECSIYGEIKKANVSKCDFCCDDISFKNKNDVYECGCMEDGVSCIPGENCHTCCNGAYDDNGTTCGGKCTKSGKSCTWNENEYSGTCAKCCNETYYKNSTIDDNSKNDTYQCGCIEDGISCIPGDTCTSCCNGAYDDKGWMCGGTCLPNGNECTIGIDCHLCCNGSEYWYSTGMMQCGSEPCYKDGESCIPGISCTTKCCSGGAYGKNDTICGGECLPSGTECTYSGTCKNCCPEDNMRYGPPYLIGFNPHWNSIKQSLVCGYELCWKDGTDCVPGYTCTNCCNPYYAEVTGVCGISSSDDNDNDTFDGTCIKKGTKCNYFSTCSLCCDQSKYNVTLGYYTC